MVFGKVAGLHRHKRCAVCDPLASCTFRSFYRRVIFRLCPVAWCKRANPRLSRADQAVTAESLRTGSSLRALRLSGDMQRWLTAHSSFCFSMRAPTTRITARTLGKIPTTQATVGERAQEGGPERFDLRGTGGAPAPRAGHPRRRPPLGSRP